MSQSHTELADKANKLREEAGLLRLLSLLMSAEVPVLEAIEVITLTNTGACSMVSVFQAITLKMAEGQDVSVQAEPDTGPTRFVSFIISGADKSELNRALMTASCMVERMARLVQAGVPAEEIARVNFYRLLGNLVAFGVPLLDTLRALKLVGYLTDDSIDGIVEALRSGDDLSESLQKQGVPEMHSSFIKVSEDIGEVDRMSLTLADVLEAQCHLATATDAHSPISAEEVGQVLDYEMLLRLQYAGLPLLRTFQMLENHSSPKNRQMFKEMAEKVEAGAEKLSDVVTGYADMFSSYMVRLIRAAETVDTKVGGTAMDGVLEQIAGFEKWQVLGIEPGN